MDKDSPTYRTTVRALNPGFEAAVVKIVFAGKQMGYALVVHVGIVGLLFLSGRIVSSVFATVVMFAVMKNDEEIGRSERCAKTWASETSPLISTKGHVGCLAVYDQTSLTWTRRC